MRCGSSLVDLLKAHSPGETPPSKGLFGKDDVIVATAAVIVWFPFLGASVIAAIPVFVATVVPAAEAATPAIPLPIASGISLLFHRLLLRLVVELDPLRDSGSGQEKAHAR